MCVIVHSEFAEEWQSALPHLEKPARHLRARRLRRRAREALDAALAQASPDCARPGRARGPRRGRSLSLHLHERHHGPAEGRADQPSARHAARRAARSRRSGSAPGDRMYVPLPLYHSAGGGMALGGALLSGAAAVIAPQLLRVAVLERLRAARRDDVPVHRRAVPLSAQLARASRRAPAHGARLRRQRAAAPRCGGRSRSASGSRRSSSSTAPPKATSRWSTSTGRSARSGACPRSCGARSGTHLIRYDVEADRARARARRLLHSRASPARRARRSGASPGSTRFEGYTSSSATEKKILRDVFEKGDAYFRTGDLLRMDARGLLLLHRPDRRHVPVEGRERRDERGGRGALDGRGRARGERLRRRRCRARRAARAWRRWSWTTKFDPAQLYAHVARELPSYARPLFVRIGAEIEITGTFKHRKVDLAKQGFDPAVVADPVLFADAARPELRAARARPLRPHRRGRGAACRVGKGRIATDAAV